MTRRGYLLAWAGVALLLLSATCKAGPAAWPADFDNGLRRAFASSGTAKADAPYAMLVRYLMTNAVDRSSTGGSRTDQPGAPSRHGAALDGMEGFTRVAPVAAAWVSGGRPKVITDLRGRSVDLVEWLRKGIVAGTTPGTPAYWGDITDLGQGIVEAGDVARSAWMARDFLLPVLTAPERDALAAWLSQVLRVKVSDNNWHLYPVLVGEVLRSMGRAVDEAALRGHFERFLSFRLGGGWYSDGPGQDVVDWYNAWAIQYELGWIRRVSPGYGGAAVGDDLRAFAADMPYLIGTDGIPIMGRSVCYRLAAPAPLVAAAIDGPDRDPGVTPGLARNALDSVTRYFVGRGAFAGGTLTQGYCGEDLRVVDNYSGPSSCLWSLRAVTLALLAGPEATLWTSAPEPLPVEVGAYAHAIPSIGWVVAGLPVDREVRILRKGATQETPVIVGALQPYGAWRKALSTILWWRPYRPDNGHAKYGLPVYSSKTPFCDCLPAAVPGFAPVQAATR